MIKIALLSNNKMCFPVRIPLILILTIHFVLISITATAKPVQPPQPINGPGGSEQLSKQIIAYRLGSGDAEYDLFIPDSPMPDKAPVVIFMHGWAAFDPRTYGSWISHIVCHDQCIVIYPRYQKYLRSLPDSYMPKSIDSIHSAMDFLHSGQLAIKPDDTRVAYIGHSVGGILAANLTSVAVKENLPVPKALLCVDPGKSSGIKRLIVPISDLSAINLNTLLITISSDEDYLVGSRDAVRIYKESTRIPSGNKNYIVLQSDNHGDPPLNATHVAPTLWQDISGATNNRYYNAYDYYCFWKITDSLLDAAFNNKHREYALGNTKQQRFMGLWSDGVPVKPLIIKSLNLQSGKLR